MSEREPTPGGRRWSFGRAEFDERTLELRLGGEPVALERKSLEVLRLLLARAGELVTKDDLLQTVWPGRVLSETVVAKCISRIREAVADDDAIKTVHGYGYRLVGPVQVTAAPSTRPVTAAAAAEAPPAAGDSGLLPRRRRRLLAAGTAGLAVVLALALAGHAWRTRPPVDASVAVLPFQILTAEPARDDHLGAGIQDSIITHLARLPGLKIISRTSTLRYGDGKSSMAEIGQALGVAYVLEGSVQRAGERVRVNAQLIEVAADRHLWAQIYDRELSDLFAIQSDIAERVARSVGAQLSEPQRALMQKPPTTSAAAYEAYLRAVEELRVDLTSRDRLVHAKAQLEQALTEDADFALAHALLARVHILMFWFGYDPAPERRDLARQSLERAFSLQPDLPEAHVSRGLYLAAGFRDYQGAIAAYQRALEGQPNLSEIHRFIASAHRRQARWDDALSAMTRAVELDPANPTVLEDLAGLYRGLKRYRLAAPLYERLIALAPDEVFFKVSQASLLFEWKGDLAPMRKVLESIPESVDPDSMITYFRYLLAHWEGRHTDAVYFLRSFPSAWLPAAGGMGRVPKEAFLAAEAELAGDARAAREYYERARALLAEEIEDRPEGAGEHAALAAALAALGDAKGAMRAIRRAVDLAPISSDPVAHAEITSTAILVNLRLGNDDQALADLERLFRIPYGASAHTLRVGSWKPYLANPRFAAIVSAHLPQE